MAKLKPCPFCGGVAERSASPITEWYFQVEAHCMHCGAEIRHRVSLPAWTKNPEKEAKRYISRMWNGRSEK